MSTLEIRDVLDGISEVCSMIVYFQIWPLTWTNIWRIEETATFVNEIGGIYCYHYLYLWKLPCAAMFLFAIFEFRCIECFAYALASLVFNIFLCLYTYPSLIVSHPFLVYCLPGIVILPSSPHSCKVLLPFVLFSLTLLSLTLLVVPPCSKVVVMTLTFTDTPKFLFFTIYILCLCCYHSKMKPFSSSYWCSSCPAAMRCSPLYFINFMSTRYWKRLILYSLYPRSDPCSFSKFIASCITCRKNGTESFSLMSPDIFLLNSEVSLYPAAPRGFVSSLVYEILWGIWIATHTIPMSIFILVAVILFLPRCCLSLWKHFITICLVHCRTWCCTFLHTLQYSVFTSPWHSFSTSPVPFLSSLHFRNAFSLLSYMCILYSSNLISSKSFASQYCLRYMYSFTDPYPSRTLCFHGSICFW